jgi:hypothetical protein
MAEMRNRIVLGAALLIGACCIGCARTLPRIHSEYLDQRMTAIPPNAAPVFSWHAKRTGLKTYWYDQDVAITVQGHLPENWAEPGDGHWRVSVRNAEGKAIPYLGIQKRYRIPGRPESAVIVPPVDLDRLPDGLYCFLIPNVSLTLGKVTSIAPVVVITEVRDHAFKPFQFPIPLVPDRKSPLTPEPPPEPVAPEGTPLPLPS